MQKSKVLSAPLLADSDYSRQLVTETQAVQNGVNRYRQLSLDAIRRGEGASVKPAERLCLHWFEPLEHLIQSEIDDCAAGKPGRNHGPVGPIIRLVKADKLAVIVMHEALGACMAPEHYTINDPKTREKIHRSGVKYRSLAYAVGRAVIAEINLQSGKKSHRESLDKLLYSVRSLTVKKVNWWANRTFHNERTNRTVTTMVGDLLLSLLMDAASCGDYFHDTFIPAFQHEVTMIESKSIGYFGLTDEAWKILDDGNNVRERLRPVYLPMVARPLPWQEANGDRPRAEGGYIRIRTPLISKITRSQKDAIGSSNLEHVFRALNAISAPALRMNKRILEVQKQVWESGGNELGLPRRDNEDLLVRPADYDSYTDAEKKKWRAAASAVFRRNTQHKANRKHYLSTLAIAEQFAPESAFYMPHQLCYRGRAYPIPQPLHHQGADHHVSLIQFANGIDAPLRELFIHAANTYGHDKVSFDDREEWGHANMREILRCAADPMNTDFWRKADKPWQFLAACMAIMNPEDGAHIPVSTDGTANGLQHYAAMLRDETLAGLVNLRPSSKPAGLYQVVADKVRNVVIAQMMNDEGKSFSFKGPNADKVTIPISKLAGMALPYAQRKFVKQPVMTDLYGVTPTGARLQIQNLLALEPGLPREHRYPIAHYLATTILGGIGDVCPSARAAMKWIRECAGLICAKNRPVTWRTPLGLPVVQPHRRLATVRVQTILQIMTLAIDDSNVPVWAHAQVDGSAPNVLHSIDGTHMLMTGETAHRKSIDFLATHDRYFSHAANKAAVGIINREQFVKLHQSPYLEVLRGQWVSLHPDISFNESPRVGNFDITEVLRSPYFFN